MYGLIGDRFLKGFFGSWFDERRGNPASAAIDSPASETDMPDEPGHTTRGNPPDTDATLANETSGEAGQPAVPENGSDSAL